MKNFAGLPRSGPFRNRSLDIILVKREKFSITVLSEGLVELCHKVASHHISAGSPHPDHATEINKDGTSLFFFLTQSSDVTGGTLFLGGKRSVLALALTYKMVGHVSSTVHAYLAIMMGQQKRSNKHPDETLIPPLTLRQRLYVLPIVARLRELSDIRF